MNSNISCFCSAYVQQGEQCYSCWETAVGSVGASEISEGPALSTRLKHRFAQDPHLAHRSGPMTDLRYWIDYRSRLEKIDVDKQADPKSPEARPNSHSNEYRIQPIHSKLI